MAEPLASPYPVQILRSPADTEHLAARLAARAKAGDIIGLSGKLGSGKTTFARAFVRARLGRDSEEVPSPTFTLVQVYEHDEGTIWHFDLYRLAAPEDAYELGIEDAFADGISLIEWPERLGSATPPDWLVLTLAPGDGPDARRATLTPHGERAHALAAELAATP